MQSKELQFLKSPINKQQAIEIAIKFGGLGSSLKQQGLWDASTNTPALANGTGTIGYYWVVSVGGTVNFGAGNITFTVGDWVYYNTVNQWVKFETGVDYVPVNKAGDTMTGPLSAPKVAIGTTNYPAIDTIGEGLVTGASLDGVTQTTRTSRSRIGNAELNFVVNHNHSATQPIDELYLQSNGDSATHVSVVNGQLIRRIRYGGRYQSGGTGAYYLSGMDEHGIDDTGTISATSMPGKRTRSITPDGSKTPVVFETVRNTGRISQKCLTLSCSNLTDAATVAVDLAASNNFNLNLTAAVGVTRQLGIPTNPEAQQEGTITVRQSSAGSNALTYAWCYIFPQFIAPTLVALKGAMSLLAYKVLSYSTATATMTIAAPCVVTWTAHGLVYGQRVAFTTTGALPTGVNANTGYYINVIDANTFNLALSATNLQAGTYITTSGSQSGVHTVTHLEIIIAMNANNGA